MTKKSRKAKSSIALFAALVMIALAMSTLFIACGGNSISLDKTSEEIYAGDTFKIEATLSDPDLDVEWTSSDTKVATVRRGTVTGVGVGTATITASVEGASATCTVTVKDRTVTMTEKTKEVNYDELGENKTVTLSASSTDGGTLTWSSSDTSVATVNGGVVTFGKPQAKTATVTITAQRGLAKDSCVITVLCPSIPDDYYALMKETNANIVQNPGKWYYHGDGAVGTDYNFSDAPAYGNETLSVELDKFSDPAGGKRFYFRYQPEFEHETKYTFKFTIETNVEGSIGYGTANLFGGVSYTNVKPNTAKNITYVGTVNNNEPFHVNINKVTGEIPEKVSIKITNIVVKEYEIGDEGQEEEPEIPDYELPSTYELVRGTASETCDDAGRWFWLVDPQDGNEDVKEATFDNGTVKFALHNSLKGTNTYHVRYQPRLKVGTKARATFTVDLDAAGSVQFGLNSDQNKEGHSRDVEVGTPETIVFDFVVTKNTPFVIQVTATDKEAPITMTVTDISFVEKLPETYTVTYDSKGGSDVPAASVQEENSIATLPVPTKDGFTFLGWFDNEACEGTAIAAPYTPTANITLYAKWIEDEAEVYTITFDSKGGSAVEAQTVEAGGSITLAVPTKDGFVFGGWFEEEACTGEALESPYTPTATATLYAKWLEEYTVSFELHHGNKTRGSVTVAEGSTTTLPAVTRKGYTLAGWYTNAEYSGEPVDNDYAPTADVTLHAKWTADAEYALASGGLGDAEGNREVWYYNLRGIQSQDPKATVNAETSGYNNGVVTLNVTGAKAADFTKENDLQLRFAPNYKDGVKYTVTFKLTTSVAGKYKIHCQGGSDQSKEIAADTETEISFTETTGWFKQGEFKAILLRFAPAVDGEVTMTVKDVVVEKAVIPTTYEIKEGLNSAVKADPGVWYYYVGDGKVTTHFDPAPKYEEGVITVNCTAMESAAYMLRYLPCEQTENKTYTFSFVVKTETEADVDLISVLSVTGSTDYTKTAGENGETVVTGTLKYVAGNNPLAIQFMPAAKIEQAVKITVSDIVFTEATEA